MNNPLAKSLLTLFLLFSGAVADDDALYEELDLLTDVLVTVERDYVQEIDSKKLIEGALKGLLSSLDPHSGYLDSDHFREMQVQTKGEFGGLGIEITMQEGVVVVIAPMEGSPAERAGIRAGDAIVKIDGMFTKDLVLMDAVKKLRGPKGSSVVLTIHRKGTKGLFDVPVIRDEIQIKSVKHRSLGDGLQYIKINQFMETTFDDVKKALKSPKGLLLDLRNNPGGLLNQAVKVSDLFLTEGIIVYTESRIETQRQKFFAHARGTEPNYPIVVLVNGGSASAAEIVAGALKDHGRAVIVGEQTFGKGSVQTISPLRNGGALSLTTALYFTKSGRSIQLTGVTPDIQVNEEPKEPVGVKVTPKQFLRESDLPGAIKNPSGLTTEEQAIPEIENLPDLPLDVEKAPIEELVQKDPFIAKGLEILKGYFVVPAAA